MGWKDLLGLGGSTPEPDRIPGGNNPAPPPADAVKKPKGLAARGEENVEQYKEAIGLLQQLVEAGLPYLDKHSDLQIRTMGMAELAAEPAHLRMSNTKGPIIEMRVPGKPEAKELQRMLREALSLPDKPGHNPLQRVEGTKKNEDGDPTYKIFLPISEYRDGKFSEGDYKVGDGLTIKRLTPPQAVAALNATLRHMGITPDWQRYYEKMDRATQRQISEEDKKLRDEMRKAEEQGGTATPADESVKRRINLNADGTPRRG